MTAPSERPDPNELLGDGSVDAAALLIVWVARKLSLAVLLVGLIVAVRVSQDLAAQEGGSQSSIDILTELVTASPSPVGLITAAVVLRVAVEVLALALTYPLTRWNRPSDYPRAGVVGRYVRLWTDRVHQAGSFRSLRWSWAVRQAAADRLGTPGHLLELASPILTSANWLLLAAIVVAIATPP